jgi:hypothetical protein
MHGLTFSELSLWPQACHEIYISISGAIPVYNVFDGIKHLREGPSKEMRPQVCVSVISEVISVRYGMTCPVPSPCVVGVNVSGVISVDTLQENVRKQSPE